MSDPSCDVAHGTAAAPATAPRTLVAVFTTPVAEYLLSYADDLGYRTVLFDPDPARAAAYTGRAKVITEAAEFDGNTDVVFTDHHRDDLGTALRDVLGHPVRWVGVMGKASVAAPHITLLRELGVAQQEIDRVHRPIGLNIGSRTPPEIAISTIAGLLAERNDRDGGFTF